MSLPYSGVTRSQYEYDKRLRLFADDLREQEWYLARGTGKDARELGHYAVETLVQLVTLQTIDDCHEVHVQVLNEDGQTIATGESILYADGILRAPDEPEEEAYMLEYPDYFDGGSKAVSEEIVLYTGGFVH